MGSGSLALRRPETGRERLSAAGLTLARRPASGPASLLGAQRLPLPIGSPHPVRRARRLFHGHPGGRRTLLAILGVVAAAGGAGLTALPPAISAGPAPPGARAGGGTGP